MTLKSNVELLYVNHSFLSFLFCFLFFIWQDWQDFLPSQLAPLPLPFESLKGLRSKTAKTAPPYYNATVWDFSAAVFPLLDILHNIFLSFKLQLMDRLLYENPRNSLNPFFMSTRLPPTYPSIWCFCIYNYDFHCSNVCPLLVIPCEFTRQTLYLSFTEHLKCMVSRYSIDNG